MMRLYAIKNDNGEWSDGSGVFYPAKKNGVGFMFTMFSDRDEAIGWAERNTNGGHIVTLIEDPEKVVLTKEQSEIVERAHNDKLPACYISSKSDDEELLMNAYVNGYTVAKENKYNVKVPHAVNSYFKKIDANYCIAGDIFNVYLDEDLAQFTEAEIEHYGLQGCEKEKVTDDEQ